MASEQACSIVVHPINARVEGVMYVSGYVMKYSDDGCYGILSVRGGGGKFVHFKRSQFYYMSRKFFEHKKLYETLKLGSLIDVLMVDNGEEKIFSSFKVRYSSVLAWFGDFPYVPPYILDNPNYFGCAKENAHPQSQLEAYDIYSDAPIRELLDLSGTIYWCCEQYGLVSFRNKSKINNVLFSPSCLYINGHKFPENEKFVVLAAQSHYNMYVKKIKPVKVFGVLVNMEAILAWRGRKPNIKLIYRPNNKQRLALQNLPDSNSNNDPQQNSNVIVFENKSNGSYPNISHVNEPLTPRRSNTPTHEIDWSENTSTHSQDSIESNVVDSYNSSVTVYKTGKITTISGHYVVFGESGNAVRLLFNKFHSDKYKFKSAWDLNSFLVIKAKEVPIVFGYATPLKSKVQIDDCTVVYEGLIGWTEQAPAFLRENISLLCRQSERNAKLESEQMVDRIDIVGKEKIDIANSVKKGFVYGYVLRCNSSQAVMTGFTNSICFSRDRFYVHGKLYKGASLLDYFNKNKEKVGSYLVPIKPTKVLGVMVFSRAVCAWIGKEPNDLTKYINQEKKNNQNYEMSSNRFSKGCFYYFVGRMNQLGEQTGVMQCDVEGKWVNVYFKISDVYKHGCRLNENTILSQHFKVLLTSRWSLLAYYTNSPVFGCNYVAIAIWHYDNQTRLFDEFQGKIPLWLQIQEKGSCQCNQSLQKLLQMSYSSIECGTFEEEKGRQLIFSFKDRGLVFVDKSKVWCDGCSCYFSTTDQRRKCFLVFADDKKTVLFGYTGKVPDINFKARNSKRCAIVNERDNDYKENKYLEDVNDLVDSEFKSDGDHEILEADSFFGDIQVSTNTHFFSARSKTKTKNQRPTSQLQDFTGRHITAEIISFTDKEVLLSWWNADICGAIIVSLNTNYFFIHKKSFTNFITFESQNNLVGQPCNVYANSLDATKMQGLLEVSLQGSVGWVGLKPDFVPSPGKQKPGNFKTKALRIAYSDANEVENLKFCNLDDWKVRLKSSVTAPLKNEVEKQQQQFDADNDGFTQMTSKRRSPTAELNGLCKTMNDTTLVDRPSTPQTKDAAEHGKSTPELCGKIVELHAKLGKLQGEGNDMFYFKPEQFFIYGVNLRGIELYNVLLTDMEVKYTKNESDQLDEVWFNNRIADSAEYAAVHLLRYCEDNFVSDDTQAAIMKAISEI